jgi:hypothetical protein
VEISEKNAYFGKIAKNKLEKMSLFSGLLLYLQQKL